MWLLVRAGIQVNPFSPWLLRPKGYCHCLRLSVCPFVRLSVRELSLVRTITIHIFELELPNFYQTCSLRYSRPLLKIGVIDLELQVNFGHFDLKFYENRFVRAIARHKFGLESTNLQQTCILGYSCLVLKIGVIDLYLQSHFGISTQSCGNVVCSRNNLKWFELESSHLHQICVLRFPWQVYHTGIINRDLQGHLAILNQVSMKWRSTSLLYTDQGRPRGITRPNVLL